MHRYEVIIFDFFGVFCAPMATNWFKKTVPNYETKLTAFQRLCTQGDLGELSREDFNKEVSKLTGISIPTIVQGIEAEMIIDTTLVSYAEKLKASGFRTACLSNGSHEWTLQAIDGHDLGYLFEAVILSSDLGIIKPDPEIYLQALRKLGVQPRQAIFIDDRKANVDAAARLGIRSLVFTSTPAFIEEFEKVTRSF